VTKPLGVPDLEPRPAGRRPYVVDWLATLFDTAALAADFGLPALLWLFLYLLAFERREFAERLGFGRTTFWLLGLGAVLAVVALLPLAPIGPDILAVSLGGGVFPLAVGAIALARTLAPGRRGLPLWLILLTIAGATLLGIVLALPAGNLQTLAVVLLCALVSLSAILIARRAPDPHQRAQRSNLAAALALTLGVAAVTFVVSTPLAGSGISEMFPIYLLPPFGAGFVAVLVWDRLPSGPSGGALSLAFAATGFGVLLGADVLREPPLYQSGYAGLYAIGGAGVFDLLYLSPLVALASAYLAHRLLGRGVGPEEGGPERDTRPADRPTARLQRAAAARAQGRMRLAIEEALRAADSAAAQARRLVGAPENDRSKGWEGVAVPPWVAADRANLEALSEAPEWGPRDPDRALIAAAGQIYVSYALVHGRFASVRDRLFAFLVDLLVVTLPAAGFWAYLAIATPGSLTELLNSPSFLAGAYGYVALAFLYFALTSYWGGRSLGKRLVHLSVTGSSLRRLSFTASLVRESTKLLVLSVLGIGAALSVALLLRGGALAAGTHPAGIALPSDLTFFISLAATTSGIVILLGTVGLLIIALSDDRQRLGDILAGSWVIRDLPKAPESSPAGLTPAEPVTPDPPAPSDTAG
jgi:uncharacterized membrane protein/uncharacterized RDD family membrane protein YckC